MGSSGIGDINSDAKGTAARDNGGKVPYELIAWKPMALALSAKTESQQHIRYALLQLGEFQTGALESALHVMLDETALAAGMTIQELLAETAWVLDYGRRKYAEWNWAKGMPWSAVMACAARHLLGTPVVPGMWDDPRGLDPDSGRLHAGHVGCNILFLLQYVITYREGDDRPEQLEEPPF